MADDFAIFWLLLCGYLCEMNSSQSEWYVSKNAFACLVQLPALSFLFGLIKCWLFNTAMSMKRCDIAYYVRLSLHIFFAVSDFAVLLTLSLLRLSQVCYWTLSQVPVSCSSFAYLLVCFLIYRLTVSCTKLTLFTGTHTTGHTLHIVGCTSPSYVASYGRIRKHRKTFRMSQR